VQELAKAFVCVMDDINPLQTGQRAGQESDLFRAIAAKGPGGGRAGTTQQGTYCFAPSGEVLSADNSRDPKRIARGLRDALARWQELPKAQRLRAQAPTRDNVRRPEESYPKDGLVLRSYSRDLPPTDGHKKRRLGEVESPWNTDVVWFRADEMKQWLPAALSKGSKHTVPDRIVRRLAQFSFIDNVVGQATPFQERCIEKASITVEVIAVTKDAVTLRLVGESKAADGARRFATTMLGSATWNPSKGRFTAFELVAVGTRSASTHRNAPDDGGTDYPVGVVLRLASDSPVDKVAPSYFGAYRW